MEKVAIGRTDLKTIPLGIGTWAWGDKLFWTYGKDYGESQVKAAFLRAVELGITLFDTAEVYGLGESERLLGGMIRQVGRSSVQVATKYMPVPWRISANQVVKAIDDSLERLQTKSVELYQIHQPVSFLMGQKTLLEVLASAVKAGKIQAIGVSNYSASQMREAHDFLKQQKIPLAVNQVQYSLLARQIETNGVLQTARDLGITILAYSPLAQGLLTGKYTALKPPNGARQLDPKFGSKGIAKIEPLIKALEELSQTYNHTPAQIALNWLIHRQVIPIPGAKNPQQAQENAEAVGWELDPADYAMLSRVSNSLNA
jgi:aryl-alcohol dehydrogenase-like predicted oxidoreductase